MSPGVQVQIIDESFYASGAPGTVPFIMLATAQDKGQPGNTIAVAPGTVKANAGKLYGITSQRELIQTFGNPRFTTQAGTPQYGSELNELGLYAAYQYLGLANRAFVIRADVDLAALDSSSVPPSGTPRNGSYWLDTANTSWGMFRSNGNINSSLAWGAIRPIVIDQAVQLELHAQGVTATPILNPNQTFEDPDGAGPLTAALAAPGNLVINGLIVQILPTDTLLSVAQKINIAVAGSSNSKIKAVRAEIAERLFTYEAGVPARNTAGTIYNLRIVSADVDIENGITLAGSDTSVLTALGLTATPVSTVVPVASLGTVGSVAVNAYKSKNASNNLVAQVQMYEKIVVTTSNTTEVRWFQIGSTDVMVPGAGWREASATVITGTDSTPGILSGEKSNIRMGDVSWTFQAVKGPYPIAALTWDNITKRLTVDVGSNWTNFALGNYLKLKLNTTTPNLNNQTWPVVGVDENIVTVQLPLSTTNFSPVGDGEAYAIPVTNLTQLVTALNEDFATNNTNAVASIVSQGPDSYLRITNYAGTDIEMVDVVGDMFESVGINQNQTFFAEVIGTTDVTGVTFDETTSITITVGGYIATISVTDPAGWSATQFKDAINANTTINPYIEASLVTVGAQTFFKIVSKAGSFFQVRNSVNTVYVNPFTQLVGIPCAATLGNQLVYQGYTQTVPQPRTQAQVAAGNMWINTNAGNRGAAWNVKRYNSGTGTWQTRPAPLYEDDTSANAAYSSQRVIGSVYVQYDSNITTPDTATLVVKVWNGTSWSPAHSLVLNTLSVPYTQSSTTPRAQPDAGTLWFNQNLRVDLMVSDGTMWMGYRNMYPNTDPEGVILSATQPSTQIDGFTPLTDQDLWIDTSDLENYPKIYRYDSLNALWTLVDNTDQTSSQGIVFADVRPNNNGLANGSEMISDMLVSNYVDSDAPSALSYPTGVLVFNMRYSSNNVKVWTPNHLPPPPVPGLWDRDRWVTASGVATNGAPYMGRKAQRRMVVQAMAAAIVNNQDVRAEGNFFNLLAAPGYPELIDELVTLNTDKKDVGFVLIDPPARLTPDGTSIQAWALNQNNAATNGEDGLITRSRYAGVYYPWGLATNLDGSEIFVPPSVAVLRTYAFNDQVSYPWFAPAGLNRGLISVLTSVGYLNGENEYVPVQLSQGQSDVLYENDVNPIRFIPGRGLVIYGQKTLSPVDSALNRVNVARLVNYLNYALDNLAKPFLFEPNDQYTRDSVQRTFEGFMGDLVTQRAVYDFAVLCDESNNTPDRIDRNELWIDIAVKPTKAVEFIYIPVRILNTDDPLPT